MCGVNHLDIILNFSWFVCAIFLDVAHGWILYSKLNKHVYKVKALKTLHLALESDLSLNSSHAYNFQNLWNHILTYWTALA